MSDVVSIEALGINLLDLISSTGSALLGNLQGLLGGLGTLLGGLLDQTLSLSLSLTAGL